MGKTATQPNGVAGFRSCGVIPFNPHATPDFAFLKRDDGPGRNCRTGTSEERGRSETSDTKKRVS